MTPALLIDQDVMQVCLNGHVITDRLFTSPEAGRTHCHRCGAATLCRCPTCGRDLPGGVPVHGLVTIGERPAPQHCPGCGARLPWAWPAPPASPVLETLEPLLRRLPRAARQLRDRHGCRPALRIDDVHDLEDLLRAVLHLHFDDVRRATRTPAYSLGTRTDFVIGPDRIAVTPKLLRLGMAADDLAAEVREDGDHYRRNRGCACLVIFVYDAEQRLPLSHRFDATDSDEFTLRTVVAH